MSVQGTWLGNYLVEETLGSGGMATVYAVRHAVDPMPLAMKVLSAAHSTDSECRTRFMREAATARALRSEHIVRVWETGELASGQPYLVMERLSGIDLDALLDARGPLPLGFVVDLALQAAAALVEAHAAGIVHRDLKPANLFLACQPDGTSILKVVDFGISKAAIWADQSLTNVHSQLGTPAYMAPEQIRSSKAVDHRADIWSLGVTIFELLTGRLPFEGRSIPALSAAILFGSPRKIRELRPELPKEVASIVARCLSKALDQRYANVFDLIRDLRALAQSIRVPAWYDDETTQVYAIVAAAPSEPRHDAGWLS